jgi:2-dehydro-3-deoxy-D-gluconate 5-dehydrogenase
MFSRCGNPHPAGVWDFASVLDMPEEGWDRVVDTNLKGPFLCAKAAAKVMVKQGRGGKIVNIASNGGIVPVFPFSVLAHYYSSKGGLIMLTKALAKELIPHHINVNCVAPGGMMTGVDAGGAGGSPGVMTKEQWEEFKKAPPPMADPDEVARIVVVLATPLANYMVGETVVVDGGALLMHVYADASQFT